MRKFRLIQALRALLMNEKAKIIIIIIINGKLMLGLAKTINRTRSVLLARMIFPCLILIAIRENYIT